MKLLIIIILIVITLQANLHFVIDQNALCLDGSRASYYFSQGSGSGLKKYFIHFEGGSWIEGLTQEQLFYSAYKRSQTDLGSSTKLKPTIQFYGAFSEDPQENPEFYNWNKIYINYCDGTGHQGYKTDPIDFNGNLLYFRGDTIIRSIISEFYDSLQKSETVIVAGCSAGGLASYYWMQHIRNILPLTVDVLGVPDSGIFIDMPAIDGSTQPKQSLMNMLNLVNQEKPNPSVECIKDNSQQEWKCFFAQYLMKYINIPIFLVQSLYDSASIKDLLNIQCARDRTLRQCSEQQINYIESLHSNIKIVIDGRFFIFNQNGAFAPSCLEHCFLLTTYFNSFDWQVPSSSGITLRLALEQWINSYKTVAQQENNHSDAINWPKNTGCSGLQNYYYR